MAPTGVVYDFTETFEGSEVDSQTETGYDNASWTSSNAANTPRDTTTPSPLAGTYSWRSTTNGTLLRAVSATANFYAYFIAHVVTKTDNSLFFEVRNSVPTTIGSIRTRATDAMRIEHGGTVSSNTSNGTFAAGSTYHVWFEWEKGTGADGVYRLYVSSTATKPAASISLTNGAATTDVAFVRFSGPTVAIFDNFVYDTSTPIGSDPV